MGNKKNSIWVVEVFTDVIKDELLKVYEFSTMAEIAYVLDMKPSTVINYFHGLIKPRGNLLYINIYRRPI